MIEWTHLQALGEEAALEQRSRSRMLYINLAGNHLRALRERAGGGRSTALGPSPEEGSAGEGCSRQPEQSRPGAKRVRRVATLPPNKARKLEAAASTVLPLDALMPSRDQLAEGGMDKQLLSSLGAGKVASAATGSSVGTLPGGRGKASVAAKVEGKCARKCRTTPKGTQSMASSVATTSGNVATVKSNSSLQEMFGSDSDSEGWEEQESWEQTMAVRAASSKGSAAVSGKKSKAKSGSRGSGAKEGAAHDAPRPHPPAKANWSIVPANQPEELTGGGGAGRGGVQCCCLCVATHLCPTPFRRTVLPSTDQSRAVRGRPGAEQLSPTHGSGGRGLHPPRSGLQCAANTQWCKWCAGAVGGGQHWLVGHVVWGGALAGGDGHALSLGL